MKPCMLRSTREGGFRRAPDGPYIWHIGSDQRLGGSYVDY